jgi:hypothetical protein
MRINPCTSKYRYAHRECDMLLRSCSSGGLLPLSPLRAPFP